MANATNINSFEQIVEKYYKMVFRTALGFVHQKEDAEDLTQEVFLRAYKGWSEFRGDSEVSTWLYRITINLSLSHMNTRSRRGILQLGEEFFHNLLSHKMNDLNPHQQLEHAENEQCIASAIDSLPEKQRTAFVLSRIDELPQKEVAAIMGVSEGSVEQLLIRARSNLQKKITKAIGNQIEGSLIQ